MIFHYIKEARRRVVWNEMMAQFALAASIMMGGLVLLLVFGTQILNWRMPVVLGIIALAGGSYRVATRFPSLYQVAIAVDRRASLQDVLSTAVHFADLPDANPTHMAQLLQAENAAARLPLADAVPFTPPRALYAMAGLGLVASSLFALRYGIEHRLDLQPPLSRVLLDTFGMSSKDATTPKSVQKRRGAAKRAEDFLSKLGITLPEAQDQKAGALDAAPSSALYSVGVPNTELDRSQSLSAKGRDPKGDGSEKGKAESGGQESGEKGDSASTGKTPADSPTGSREGPQQGEQAATKPGNASDSSSLMSKLRDAMANMLSKAKPQPNGAGQKPSTSQGKPAGAQTQSAEKNAAAGKGQQSPGQQTQDAQDGEQQGNSEDAQNATGKGAGKSADSQPASQPGSGAGKQDGLKDLKAAEQLAAMGKLSQIIGKRSANVTGDITIEVQSSSQQLRTPYSQRQAQHSQTSGDISRDEVPVTLQPYIQQYFEEVRKQGAPMKSNNAKP